MAAVPADSREPRHVPERDRETLRLTVQYPAPLKLDLREPAADADGRPQVRVAHIFDEAAGYYGSMRWERNRIVRFEKSMTRQVLEEELGDRRVARALEIGCGPGTWTGLLAERSESVLALDLSEGMLEQARRAVTESNVHFQHADAARFRADTGFDLVMSVRVLEYVPEWREIVNRLGSMVTPGGQVVIVTKTPISIWRGTGRNRWFGARTLARRLTFRRADPGFWQRHLPVGELARTLGDAGFTDIRIRPVIFGAPIYMRGTRQYPLIPGFAEKPALRATHAAWRWVSERGPLVRRAALILSESYAVSGRRRLDPESTGSRSS